MKDLSVEEKKEVGPIAQEIKQYISSEIHIRAAQYKNKILEEQESSETIDVSLQFPLDNCGHRHPISIVTELLEDIFISLGYKIEKGPQIETVEMNFDKLNIPADHPARDVWDTFWLEDGVNQSREDSQKYLLRTHTSPVQIRTMLTQKPPIKIIVPGRVFRYEQEDARHTCNFYQLEGLMVAE